MATLAAQPWSIAQRNLPRPVAVLTPVAGLPLSPKSRHFPGTFPSRHCSSRWCLKERSREARRRSPVTVAMGLKGVESFDTSFELNLEAKEVLVFLLSSEAFLEQVGGQPGLPEGSRVIFTGELFQPVPWSPTTRFGMPQEFEKFHHDKENYAIINVPPNFMFKAQIFKPSRLCAIYQIVDKAA